MSARIIEVIECVITRGNGTPEDPCRAVVQYFTRDGELLAENDPTVCKDLSGNGNHMTRPTTWAE